MSDKSVIDQQTMVGTAFVTALTLRDFERLAMCFQEEVKFRALVPSGVREGSTATEATAWLRKWFGDADEFYVLSSSVDQVADRLYITYRIRVRELSDWKLIEQQAYCVVDEDLITVMNLLCSGFRPEAQLKQEQPAMNNSSGQSKFGADAYYDAGARGCAEGPIDEIARKMNQLASGQTLEVHATDPSVIKDLPAWCRLLGHDFVKQEGHHYLIRHK